MEESMPKFRYVPILRSKAGEATALQNLSAANKARMFPLIHISAKPPSAFATKIAVSWAKLPMALDGLFYAGVMGSTAQFTKIFHELGKGGVRVIPSVECDSPAPYVAAIKGLIGRYAPGLVITATPRHLPTLVAWVAAEGWKPADVDLVINVGVISAYGASLVVPVVISAIQSYIPSLSPWRSVTLASSAAPKDFGALSSGLNLIARDDWHLWQRVSSQVPFQLDYGDYGVAHPDLTEPPGAAMARATVSARYTLDDEWMFIKGSPIGGQRGKPMPAQYTAHAKALAALPQFGGLAACWADQRIQQIVAGKGTSGSRQTWVEIGANRHLSLVANRLP